MGSARDAMSHWKTKQEAEQAARSRYRGALGHERDRLRADWNASRNEMVSARAIALAVAETTRKNLEWLASRKNRVAIEGLQTYLAGIDGRSNQVAEALKHLWSLDARLLEIRGEAGPEWDSILRTAEKLRELDLNPSKLFPDSSQIQAVLAGAQKELESIHVDRSTALAGVETLLRAVAESDPQGAHAAQLVSEARSARGDLIRLWQDFLIPLGSMNLEVMSVEQLLFREENAGAEEKT